MDENDPILDDECPNSEHNRLLRIAAWAKEHDLLDADGEPRKILGTLPVTADGVLAGTGGIVYVNTDSDGTQMDCVAQAVCDDYDYHNIQDCYSTREAAERAAKERSDGQ